VPIHVDVVRNSALSSALGGGDGGGGGGDTFARVRARYDCVVVSPGPGLPSRAADFGACAEVILGCGGDDLPLLGVCLGHQGIAEAFGGVVVHAPEVAHGVVSRLVHDETDELFAGVPREFNAVRYHSWLAELPAPSATSLLRPIATTVEDGVTLLMAVRHVSRPMWGVQFHPESVCTDHGPTILTNFLTSALARRRDHDAVGSGPCTDAPPPFLAAGTNCIPEHRRSQSNGAAASDGGAPSVDSNSGVQLLFDHISVPTGAKATKGRDVGAALHAALVGDARRSFWLDSSMIAADNVPGGQYSFMGLVDTASPRCKTVEFVVPPTFLAQVCVCVWGGGGGQRGCWR
jgi:para-aminobenzoate synthetase